MNVRGRYVLNQHHEPVPVKDLFLWAAWFEEDETRIVKQDTVTELGELVSPFKSVFVSTVFLGLDHNFMEKGPPILFETMVFGGPFNHTMWRYATWDEAVKGHEQLVKMVRDPSWLFRQIKFNIKRWWTDRRRWAA
jgi:hypothetical protein